MKTTILGAAAIVVAMAMPAFAQTYRSDVREHRQEHRIERGVRHGQLTRHEARKLEHQQNRIHRMERRSRAMNGGYIDPRTERKIERIQDRASRKIERKKHNLRHY